MSGAVEPPANYDEWMQRCITEMENAQNASQFQGKLLISPNELNGWYRCCSEYLGVSVLTGRGKQDGS